jgi:Icc-related predicted phosphoesterase
MHLRILGDLHLEFAPFVPPAVKADAVILAGDIGTGRSGLKWALKTFPALPVVYVLGNHEFYGQKLPKLIDELRDLASGTNVHVLENESLELGGVVFFGATLWTDFALDGDPVLSEDVAQTSLNDYRRIRTLPHYSRLRPSDTRRIHLRSRQRLAESLPANQGRKLVVVTHHAPSRLSLPPAFEGDPCNPAFASELTPLIVESEARLWVHGHIHYACDYTLGKTRVLANPRGYPTESRTGFDPGLTVEV